MAIVGWEIMAILGILVTILIWGPSQIPKIAKSIGLARKELETTKKQLIEQEDGS